MCKLTAEFVLYNPDTNLIQHPGVVSEKMQYDTEEFFDGRYCPHHLSIRIRAMGYRTPVVGNLNYNSNFKCDGELEPLHVFSFEIWADSQLGSASYPMQLPRRTPRFQASTPKEAREFAKTFLNDNESIGAGSHIRSMCIPPHPGKD